MEIDVRNYLSTASRPKTRKVLKDIIVELALTDIWRELHPDLRRYTWRKFKSIKQARLDYLLILESCSDRIQNCTIDAGHRSDHSPVTLIFKTSDFTRDRPMWKFNNSLLHDKDYIDEIKKIILQVKQQYVVLVYNFDKINDIENSNLVFRISDQLFFETLLFEIRGKTISYSSFKKKLTDQNEKQLKEELSNIEHKIEEVDLPKIETIKLELEEIRKKKVEGIIVRSRAKWCAEGEKPSQYFCHLESRHYKSKCINILEKENGIFITEQKDILNEVKQYYETLYLERQTQGINLQDLFKNNKDIPCILDTESDSLEGALLVNEAKEALKNMQNNTSPGPDGFTVEIF